ncbi:RNA-binding protein 43 [Brachyistius frenatus]|uniref:RNA-binding protein 43 n=1 Tax=Brachyistius frenatus TaxID=100188 RepID=UPI0037E87019
MDLQVEATVRLNKFPDEAEALRILRLHHFQKIDDLGGGQVRVRGCFSNLKAAKALLEQLVEPPSKTTLRSSSPLPTSGAVSKYYHSTDRGRSPSRDEPPRASPSSPAASSSCSSSYASASSRSRPTSQGYGASSSSDRRASRSAARLSFVVDSDVFRYAQRLRARDIEDIVNAHDVRMDVQDGDGRSEVTLLGRSSWTAAGKLRSVLDNLSKSLRTQEVPLEDVNRKGRALLETIRKNRNVYSSVLVYELSDGLHLVGPSSESYELKQRLLGTPVGGRAGRSVDRNSSRRRTSSLPATGRKNADGESRDVARPPPAGTPPGPSERQGGKRGGVEPQQGAAARHGAALRRRSHSESRRTTEAERVSGRAQERENTRPPPQAAGKKVPQLKKCLFTPKIINQIIRNCKR